MNNVDRQYLDIARDILENGTRKDTRAGEVLSVFDRSMRFDLKEGLPLLTTKKVFTRGCIIELLWFLSGDTNIKYLVDNNVNIWNDDAYRYYNELVDKHNKCVGETDTEILRHEVIRPIQPVSKEQFIECVKNEETLHLCIDTRAHFMSFIPNQWEYDYKYGDLGAVYGRQWRSFNGFDQIEDIIDKLKTNPDDRRMICSAYNPAEQNSTGAALPPCHVMFQFYTRKLNSSERIQWYKSEYNPTLPEDASDEWLDKLNIPERELSMMFLMRSSDVPLGLPINILSYSLLVHMMCRIVNMIPGEVVYHGVDVHIYTNQIDGINEQLKRNGSDVMPKLRFTNGKQFKDLSDFTYEDFIIEDYHPDGIIKFPLSVG